MPEPYDRNRPAEGRWDEQDDRGRDDRGRRYGRFMDQEERGSYYGQRGYDEDRYRGPEYESRYGGGGFERSERDRDDYRGERGDHRGWYGDSRRHAAAARRGWRHRQD